MTQTTESAHGEIILYQRDDGADAIEVQMVDGTVWLTQQQLAELFSTSRRNIGIHLQNIYEEGELTESATRKDFFQVRHEGLRAVTRAIPHYNLDAIISVGYRVKSATATRFRMWATERLHELGLATNLGPSGGIQFWPRR